MLNKSRSRKGNNLRMWTCLFHLVNNYFCTTSPIASNINIIMSFIDKQKYLIWYDSNNNNSNTTTCCILFRDFLYFMCVGWPKWDILCLFVRWEFLHTISSSIRCIIVYNMLISRPLKWRHVDLQSLIKLLSASTDRPATDPTK